MKLNKVEKHSDVEANTVKSDLKHLRTQNITNFDSLDLLKNLYKNLDILNIITRYKITETFIDFTVNFELSHVVFKVLPELEPPNFA